MQPDYQPPNSQEPPYYQPQPNSQQPSDGKPWSGSTYASHSNTTSYEPPAYAYADQSLYPTHDTLPAIRSRRVQFRLLRTLIQACFVALPFFGAFLLPAHYAAVYTTYQQGKCVITEKDVEVVNHKDKHGHITSTSYYPHLFYTVETLDGQNASSSGYDGPTKHDYGFPSDAQSVIDQYQVGQVVPCMYNPATPSKAFLVFYGYTASDSAGTGFVSFLVFAGFSMGLYLLLDWTVWRLFALWRRGVVTEGMIVRHEERRRNKRRVTVSIIDFRALEESDRRRQIVVDGVRPIGSQTPVCYDPLLPRYRRDGYLPGVEATFPGAIGMAVVGFIGLIVLLIAWLVP